MRLLHNLSSMNHFVLLSERYNIPTQSYLELRHIMPLRGHFGMIEWHCTYRALPELYLSKVSEVKGPCGYSISELSLGVVC